MTLGLRSAAFVVVAAMAISNRQAKTVARKNMERTRALAMRELQRLVSSVTWPNSKVTRKLPRRVHLVHRGGSGQFSRFGAQFEAHVVGVSKLLELPHHPRIVDFSRAGFVAAGVVGNLNVAELVDAVF